MDRRVWIIALLTAISVPWIMYDNRYYSEYNNLTQHHTLTLTHEMPSNVSDMSLNLSESLVPPPYHYISLHINSISILRIVFSINNSELCRVHLFSDPFDDFAVGNITASMGLEFNDLSFTHSDNLTLYLSFENLSENVDPDCTISIDIDFILYGVFWRPPKHTISGSIVNFLQTTDPREWIFIGVIAMSLTLIFVSSKLLMQK